MESADSDDILDPGLCDYKEFFNCDDGSLDLGDNVYNTDDNAPLRLHSVLLLLSQQ